MIDYFYLLLIVIKLCPTRGSGRPAAAWWARTSCSITPARISANTATPMPRRNWLQRTGTAINLTRSRNLLSLLYQGKSDNNIPRIRKRGIIILETKSVDLQHRRMSATTLQCYSSWNRSCISVFWGKNCYSVIQKCEMWNCEMRMLFPSNR